MVGTHRRPHDQVLRVILLFKNVVVEKNAVRGTSILGEHSNQSGFELPSQVFRNSPNVRITEKKIDFIFAFGISIECARQTSAEESQRTET